MLNARMDLLKEQNQSLKTRLEEAEGRSLDVLAQALAERSARLTEELTRLHAHHQADQETISLKEQELGNTTGQVVALERQLGSAQETLRAVAESQLLCPHCGAALETRRYDSMPVFYQGRDVDVEHELVRYQCDTSLLMGR